MLSLFNPIKFPSEWMFPIDPIWSEEHQRYLKRYRLFDAQNGPIMVEAVMSLIKGELVSVPPMEGPPLSLAFYANRCHIGEKSE